MFAHFGPAGNPDAFYEAGFKASAQMPAWLAGQNLTAYEYQCSRGANVREETARLVGEKAAQYGVKLSIHAPYYISLATEDETTAANTQKHFLKTLEIASWMGADRVIFHIGGIGKQGRPQAMETAKGAFAKVLESVVARGLNNILLAPETMGKRNQLGTLEEVLEFCQMADWMIPAIDFGHLHAVSGGRYTTKEEFESVFDRVEEVLGSHIAGNAHIHFSRIEFTKAGEKRHWTFQDPYGPPHEPLLAVIAERKYTPRIICESAGTQARDAKIMQDAYRAMLNKSNNYLTTSK
ncbi:MAG TPA: TIM barrel protein [Methylomusa anaerophila]|uniref:Putative endonuclease 4 n=1 Tax=Methylomusa anaerophila TaxID=1930071 RepID=A0A348ANP1_9FIRM|nr:TIM barrel protein [Methylomusa anaerophila]BBB92689.1 putative endonuclease 4 [Methylomusa anaerophila]HML87458.1 TIM barrel protein [Methylomusa anaerophila]